MSMLYQKEWKLWWGWWWRSWGCAIPPCALLVSLHQKYELLLLSQYFSNMVNWICPKLLQYFSPPDFDIFWNFSDLLRIMMKIMMMTMMIMMMMTVRGMMDRWCWERLSTDRSVVVDLIIISIDFFQDLSRFTEVRLRVLKKGKCWEFNPRANPTTRMPYSSSVPLLVTKNTDHFSSYCISQTWSNGFLQSF